MEEVQQLFDEKGKGSFFILDGKEQIALMAVGVSGNLLTAFHTEVQPKAGGKGYAKKLLTAMTDYARKNNLKVKPLCPYVHAQFKRNGDAYKDLWNGD